MGTATDKAQHHKAIHIALENSYIMLAMFDCVGRHEGISNRMKIAPAMARAEARLSQSWTHKDLTYADVGDILDVAAEAGREIWNPEKKDLLHRYAITCLNDRARAEQHDLKLNDAQYVYPEPVESIKEKMLLAADQLPPTAERDLNQRALQEGLVAMQQLSQILEESDSQVLSGRNRPVNLPRINVDAMDTTTARIWLDSMAVHPGLPDETVLGPLMREAERTGQVCENTVADAAKEWDQAQPNIDLQYATQSLKAISAAATRLNIEDTSDVSSPAEQVTGWLATIAKVHDQDAAAYRALHDTLSGSTALTKEIRDTEQLRTTITSAMQSLQDAVKAYDQLQHKSIEASTPQEIALLSDLSRSQTQIEELISEMPETINDLVEQCMPEQQRVSHGPS